MVCYACYMYWLFSNNQFPEGTEPQHKKLGFPWCASRSVKCLSCALSCARGSCLQHTSGLRSLGSTTDRQWILLLEVQLSKDFFLVSERLQYCKNPFLYFPSACTLYAVKDALPNLHDLHSTPS